MRKLFLSLYFFFFSGSSLIIAQQPQKLNTSQIYEALQKLNFLGSVLYVAAHPDDENTRLISYISNQLNARTAYLSLTRGDGGQNLIGPELRELLGVIRTQELLAARRVDGGEQLFTRANDFGYSKHPDETLNIWNKSDVLSDVVLAIRRFKPDIIINRFDHRTPGTTHGHHTSSAMLSMEAFDLANNNSTYPEQLKTTSLWQPKRLFFNTSWWFYGSRENFEKADKSQMLNVDIGVYYPEKGLSNNEVSAIARSQHLCQGFGRLTQRGSQLEYIEFLKGDFPQDKTNMFSGIDTSWNRIKGGNAIGDILYEVENNFNFKDPATHLPDLMKSYNMLQNIEDTHWKVIKTKEIKTIIEACAGLYLEASAEVSSASKISSVKLNIEAINRSSSIIKLESISQSDGKFISKNILLENNKKETLESNFKIPSNATYTTPYWLNKTGTLGMYRVEDENLIGMPETPQSATLRFNLTIENQPISFTKNVIYRYTEPDKGELYKPFAIIPAATVKIDEKVIIFNNSTEREIPIIVTAGKDSLEGFVSIKHPYSWQVFPKQQKVSILKKGNQQTVVFTVFSPQNESEGYIQPIVTVGNEAFTKERVEINYNHIPFQTVLLPSKIKVVRLNIKKQGENIAYIQGAGDSVPESLQQIGYTVLTIKLEDITPETLNRFDAVVLGIRAFNTIEALKFKQDVLFDFVANGGNMIVQYNTRHRLKTKVIAPYDITLSRDRVTDENAEVRFLNPEHELLNFPNKIIQTDFEGWTQERGLYFPNEWAAEFTPILSMNDKGESPKEGSLLVAKHGKGHYIYTGLSFFREFPAGVSGAYKLFANMLSIGKENLSVEKNEIKN